MSITGPVRSSALGVAPGDMLAERWRVDAVLQGAMGFVLLLHDPATGALYAAKTPRTTGVGSDGTLRRFAAEARLWLSLGRDPHVVEAFFLEELAVPDEFGSVAVRPFLFLERITGPTLERVLEVEGRLALPVALDIATGLAWGMATAHGERSAGPRLVHRDLKPENVFITRARIAKVSDFGIARAIDSPNELDSDGVGVGTPFYAAPEQMKDARSADRRSDVYSFGAVVYQMLTGTPPFPADDLPTLVWKVLRETPRAPSEVVARIPEQLDQLILACLEKQPDSRPPDFKAILRELSEIREIDEVWLPTDRSRSCEACGWLSVRPVRRCVLCSTRLSAATRYAPASRRGESSRPTLDRRPGSGSVVLEGMETRPRVPRAREPVVLTVLLGNPGAEPVEDVVVPSTLPDADAFTRPDGASPTAFDGTVPPTANGAPLRVSWTVIPLRAGTFSVPPPVVSYRAAGGGRLELRGEPTELVVAPNDDLPLVGRGPERAELQRSVGIVKGGGAVLVALLADPGYGKSRLIREASERAAQAGFSLSRGRVLGRGGEVRGALREALRMDLGLRGRDAFPIEVAAALVEVLGGPVIREPGLLPFLTNELCGRAPEPGVRPTQMWARALVALARGGPRLFVLEDVHLDFDVAEIGYQAVRLARRERVPLLVLLAGRPGTGEDSSSGALDYADRLLARARGEGEPDELLLSLRLGPVSPAALAELFRAAFEPNDFDHTVPWLAGDAARLAGGNPLVALELARELQAASSPRGPLVVTDFGRWTATPALTREALGELLPERLEQLVLRRVDALPAEERLCLETAGSLGDIFETELLGELLGNPAWFSRAVARLERDLVLRELPSNTPRIRFREPLLPDALDRELARTDPERRRHLHDAAAQWLMQRPAAGARYAMRLARHLEAAGRAVDAFHALLDAARRLIRRQSYDRAMGVLRRAEQAVAQGAEVRSRERMEFLLLLAEALRYTGDYSGALRAYSRIVSGEAGPASEDRLGLVFSKMGRVHEALGNLSEALYAYAVGLSLREDHGDVFEVPNSLVNLAGLHLRRGEDDLARDYLERAFEAARRLRNGRALGRAHIVAARVCVTSGKTREARRHARQAIRQARLSGRRTDAADARSVLGHANFQEGRLLRASMQYRRALRTRQTNGDLPGIARAWGDLGAALEALSDLDEASRCYRRSADLHTRIGAMVAADAARGRVGRVLLRAGHAQSARELLEMVCRERRAADEPGAAEALADLARVQRVLGARAESDATLAEAFALAESSADGGALARVALVEADFALADGRLEDAAGFARAGLLHVEAAPDIRVSLLAALAEGARDEEAARSAEELATTSPSPFPRARALAAAGRVALAAGRHAEAADKLRRAAGLLRESHIINRLLVGVTRDEARALAVDNPAAAEAARARACDAARALEARGYVETGLGRDAGIDCDAR